MCLLFLILRTVVVVICCGWCRPLSCCTQIPPPHCAVVFQFICGVIGGSFRLVSQNYFPCALFATSAVVLSFKWLWVFCVLGVLNDVGLDVNCFVCSCVFWEVALWMWRIFPAWMSGFKGECSHRWQISPFVENKPALCPHHLPTPLGHKGNRHFCCFILSSKLWGQQWTHVFTRLFISCLPSFSFLGFVRSSMWSCVLFVFCTEMETPVLQWRELDSRQWQSGHHLSPPDEPRSPPFRMRTRLPEKNCHQGSAFSLLRKSLSVINVNKNWKITLRLARVMKSWSSLFVHSFDAF